MTWAHLFENGREPGPGAIRLLAPAAEALQFPIIYDAKWRVARTAFERWEIPYRKIPDAMKILGARFVRIVDQHDAEFSIPQQPIESFDPACISIHRYLLPHPQDFDAPRHRIRCPKRVQLLSLLGDCLDAIDRLNNGERASN